MTKLWHTFYDAYIKSHCANKMYLTQLLLLIQKFIISFKFLENSLGGRI